MGRPYVNRAIKRTRLYDCGAGDDYAEPGTESLSSAAVALIADGAQKLAKRVRAKVKAKRAAKKAKRSSAE